MISTAGMSFEIGLITRIHFPVNTLASVLEKNLTDRFFGIVEDRS
jgi:hypothetical protein